MIIKEEDWDSIGNAKKEEIGACEVCGKKAGAWDGSKYAPLTKEMKETLL